MLYHELESKTVAELLDASTARPSMAVAWVYHRFSGDNYPHRPVRDLPERLESRIGAR